MPLYAAAHKPASPAKFPTFHPAPLCPSASRVLPDGALPSMTARTTHAFSVTVLVMTAAADAARPFVASFGTNNNERKERKNGTRYVGLRN
jgi:hypothetical protein